MKKNSKTNIKDSKNNSANEHIDFEYIANQLNLCEAILKNRNTAEKLKELYEDGLLATISNKWNLIGAAALWPTGSEEWLELGSTIIFDKFRGKGHLQTLYFGIQQLLDAQNKKGFLITNNPMIINITCKSKEKYGLGWERKELSWLSNVFPEKTGDEELDSNNKMILDNRLENSEYKNSLLFVQP